MTRDHMTPQQILEAIAALPDSERSDLLSRLRELYGIPAAPPARQLGLTLADWDGPADHLIVFDGGSQGNPSAGYGSYAIFEGTHAGEVTRLSFPDPMTNNEPNITPCAPRWTTCSKDWAHRRAKSHWKCTEIVNSLSSKCWAGGRPKTSGCARCATRCGGGSTSSNAIGWRSSPAKTRCGCWDIDHEKPRPSTARRAA